MKHFGLDFEPPDNVSVRLKAIQEELALTNQIGAEQAFFISGAKGQSRILLDAPDRPVVWSQAKQTGDVLNDGMHEFLLYRPSLCGVDLLYNTSSNWLAVIDTSGPCLSMPPFFFDRLMTQIAGFPEAEVDCPFRLGMPSRGQLCSLKRTTASPGGRAVKLPTLYFQLEDDQEPAPPKVPLPLERLAFRNGSGQELLCVSRSDDDDQSNGADMIFSHIAFGSLAVAALYTTVNLENYTIGLAPKGNASLESTNEFCVKPVVCKSSMQRAFPPLNICEDPDCSEYMFMTLDDDTKMCRWNRAVPVAFVMILLSLLTLDLLSHRLYKQAIARASEFCQ